MTQKAGEKEFEGAKVEERCLESGRKNKVKSEILERI